MDPALRQAWTEIVTADDYEEHMASIGQAQAAAELTAHLIRSAPLTAGSRITIAGAGTGQMFDFLDPAVFRPYRFTCADLNPAFLSRLRERLARHRLEAEIVEDDIERTALESGPDLLLATLFLEHIDWQRGIEAFAGLKAGSLRHHHTGESTWYDYCHHAGPPIADLGRQSRGDGPSEIGAA